MTNPAGPRSYLDHQQILFIEEFIRNRGNGAVAYGLAYPNSKPENRSAYSARILKIALVQEELKRRRQEIEKETEYTVKESMADLEKAEKLAERTENANALAKVVELRMKLHGLLVEKHDHSFSGFNLMIGGLTPPPLPAPQKIHEDIDVTGELLEDEGEYEENPDIEEMLK